MDDTSGCQIFPRHEENINEPRCTWDDSPNRRDRNVKHGLTNAASHEPPFRFHDALKSRSNRNPPSLWTCRGSMIMGRVIRIAAGNWISRYRDGRIFRSKGGVETNGGSSKGVDLDKTRVGFGI